MRKFANFVRLYLPTVIFRTLQHFKQNFGILQLLKGSLREFRFHAINLPGTGAQSMAQTDPPTLKVTLHKPPAIKGLSASIPF